MLSRLRAWLARVRSRFGGPEWSNALVHVYLREARFFVEHLDRTRRAEAGFWVGSGSVTTLDVSCADQDLGMAVMHALDRSRLEVPIPPRDARLEAELFKAMGVRSRRAAMEGTETCSVERFRNGLRVQPYRNGGTSGPDRGYIPLDDSRVVMLQLDVSADALGSVLRETLLALVDSGGAGT